MVYTGTKLAGGVIERESTVGSSGEAMLCMRAVALMRACIANPLTISELAIRLNVSRTKLIRVFTATHGDGVASYYLKLRLDFAKTKLPAGEKAVAAATDAGFSSYRAFSEAFRKHTGRTPGEFGRNSG